jgi:hypothetical protein
MTGEHSLEQFLTAKSERVPNPLARMAERLGRAQGRQPLPSVFEAFLREQLERERVSPPSRSALLPSRDVALRMRGRAKARARRPDL